MRNICVTLVLVAWRMVEESVGMACSRLHQIPSLDLGFLPLRNLGAFKLDHAGNFELIAISADRGGKYGNFLIPS